MNPVPDVIVSKPARFVNTPKQTNSRGTPALSKRCVGASFYRLWIYSRQPGRCLLAVKHPVSLCSFPSHLMSGLRVSIHPYRDQRYVSGCLLPMPLSDEAVDFNNTRADVYGDGAYPSKEREKTAWEERGHAALFPKKKRSKPMSALR